MNVGESERRRILADQASYVKRAIQVANEARLNQRKKTRICVALSIALLFSIWRLAVPREPQAAAVVVKSYSSVAALPLHAAYAHQQQVTIIHASTTRNSTSSRNDSLLLVTTSTVRNSTSSWLLPTSHESAGPLNVSALHTKMHLVASSRASVQPHNNSIT
eukprot:CAMPEP_0119307276 /NCGR_PEP_ID=MMETSP1333-20130426/7822_1 /TAXON_ID=418940 /ORGANISM="Scyphosphaera apsteinii, Strain RCC1455" /LENGTH=161 /DNA_ID=CAMNT_0007310783 /DNA_START=259 /DNA_END=744 /DNA_ORIENTATION=-